MRNPIRSDTPDDRRPSSHLPRFLRGAESGEVEKRRERAILVSVLLPDTKADLRDPLGELTALAESAGVEVVDAMMQKRMSLGAAYALGKGKLAELVERAEANEADTVILDNDLTPRQIRGLEQTLNRKVIDRTELILDIFALRAKTREAQLEVELAQLQYTAPRLRGLWTHLERIAGAGGATAAGSVGGVGTRGPGERQIEIDRRIVQKRITHLKRELGEIDRRKQREVRSRRDQFTVSLVGYTNSGKSTLMSRLTGMDRLAADMLFSTLDTKTVRWDLGEGRYALLSDTVGFIRDIPHLLLASFQATLAETIHADLLLHIVDAASPTAYQQIEAVDDVLNDLGCEAVPQVIVLNKVDLADPAPLVALLAHRKSCLQCVSALTGAGLSALAETVTGQMLANTVEVTLRFPHAEGKLNAEIDRLADTVEREYLADVVQVVVRIDRTQLRQLLGRHRSLAIVGGDVESADDLEPDGLDREPRTD